MDRDTIFISHASPEDNEFVRWLSGQLANQGFKVWADISHLKGGTPFWTSIEEVLRRHTVKMIFVASRRSVDAARSGVRNELSVGDGLRRSLRDPEFIIPIRIDDTPFDEMPIQLHQLNALDFSAEWNGGLTSLLETLDAARVPRIESLLLASKLARNYAEATSRCEPVEHTSHDSERDIGQPLTAGALPAETTGLVGRERELTEIAGLLSTTRLVTLTGVGGVGKTRLAIRSAANAAEKFPAGVRLVECASLRDAGGVAIAVAGVLAVAQQPGQSIMQSVIGAVGDRRMLLVLDNCEQVIIDTAEFAERILASCPSVTLLATSRETLSVEGEQVWPVFPLVCGGIQSAGVQLFVERARGVAPDFAPDPELEAISDICRRLDGIPLAIELAAARTRAMSCTQIRDRLDARFRLLTRGGRHSAERHQTLQQAVKWSYDLLTPDEQTALLRVSVFAGGFTLEAAEQVCAGGVVAAPDVLDLLDSLVRKSLVVVERQRGGIRYALLETIRLFAEEQRTDPAEDRALRYRHAQCFADGSDANFATWRSAQQGLAYEWLDRELANLRIAFRWARNAGEIDFAVRIASNVGDMARFRIREDAAGWAEEILDSARATRHPRLTVLLTWAASSAWAQGRLGDAKRFGQEAIDLVGDAHFEPFAWAFTDLATIASYEGDVAAAEAFARLGAAQAADAKDCFCQAMLPHFLVVSGRAVEAIEAADRAVRSAEATSIPNSIAMALWARGEAYADRDPVVAIDAYERGIEIARASGNRFWDIVISSEATALQVRSDDPAMALRTLARMLDLWRGSTDLMVVSRGLGSLVVFFERLGDFAAAATLHGATARMLKSSAFMKEYADAVARVRSAIGTAAFDMTSGHGSAMGLGESLDYARQQISTALAKLEPALL